MVQLLSGINFDSTFHLWRSMYTTSNGMDESAWAYKFSTQFPRCWNKSVGFDTVDLLVLLKLIPERTKHTTAQADPGGHLTAPGHIRALKHPAFK